MSPAATPTALEELQASISNCRLCPRLVTWREGVAVDPPRRFQGMEYWSRPLPGFGDPEAKVMVTGLAPAAHGSNRTGRVFTGDNAGAGLFASLYRTGFANQAESTHRGDGLALNGIWVNAAVRCAPPQNKPTTKERDRCLPFLAAELDLLHNVNTIVALGAFGWDCVIRAVRALDGEIPRPKPRFGHGVETRLGRWRVIGCFHPSQRNTYTGRLTETMLDEVFTRASSLSRGKSL